MCVLCGVVMECESERERERQSLVSNIGTPAIGTIDDCVCRVIGGMWVGVSSTSSIMADLC